MTASTLGFLKKLLDTAGPSGFEQAPARVWRAETEGFADEVWADVHGNSIAALNPKGKPRLMLAGHIDEIGLQVTHIDDDGFLFFGGIGGWDSQVLVGQRVLLLGRSGPVRGVIGKKAVHHLKKEDLDKVSKVADLWIDIGAANKAEAGERVRVGDAGVLDTGVQEYPNGRIVSRSIDNRIGAYVVAEAVRRLAADRPKHAAVFAVATTREEIAWQGGGARTSAAGLDPQVALVVDVTHATDYPGAEKKQAGDARVVGEPGRGRSTRRMRGQREDLVYTPGRTARHGYGRRRDLQRVTRGPDGSRECAQPLHAQPQRDGGLGGSGAGGSSARGVRAAARAYAGFRAAVGPGRYTPIRRRLGSGATASSTVTRTRRTGVASNRSSLRCPTVVPRASSRHAPSTAPWTT
jgi:endoglucanase